MGENQGETTELVYEWVAVRDIFGPLGVCVPPQFRLGIIRYPLRGGWLRRHRAIWAFRWAACLSKSYSYRDECDWLPWMWINDAPGWIDLDQFSGCPAMWIGDTRKEANAILANATKTNHSPEDAWRLMTECMVLYTGYLRGSVRTDDQSVLGRLEVSGQEMRKIAVGLGHEVTDIWEDIRTGLSPAERQARRAADEARLARKGEERRRLAASRDAKRADRAEVALNRLRQVSARWGGSPV